MKISALRAVLVLALAAACHDDGSTDFVAPSVALTFPPLVSSTDQASITVTGTAFDPGGVAQVSVNGVLATTSDGFATWHASVPLVPGTNTLTVAAMDLLGNSDSTAAEARIESLVLLLSPLGIAVDAFAQVAYVLSEEGIRAVDLASGARTTVSGAARGTGPALNDGFGIALDPIGQQALVTKFSIPGWVTAVDLASGNRAILSDDTHGMGPSLGGILAITIDGDRALVTCVYAAGAPAILAIDLASGDRTILSNASVGSGPALQRPRAIVLDGNRALVEDSNKVLAVDLATGDRTILSDGSSPGPDLVAPVGITVDRGRALVLDSGLDAVVEVDLVSGHRTILSDAFQGGGPALASPRAIALDGHQALVTDGDVGALLGVDLVTGERSFVSAPTSVGTGPSFGVRAVTLDGERALMPGARPSSLVALDLASGDRTIVCDSFTGSGPDFGGVEALVVDGGRALVVAGLVTGTSPDEDESNLALFAVDLASGDRSLLSAWSKGAGPTFDDPRDIAVFQGQALIVAFRSDMMAVDLASGDRRFIESGPGIFESPKAIVVDGNRALVLTDLSDSCSAVFAVDLASEERSLVSHVEIRGAGPNLRDSRDMVLDGDRVLVTSRIPTHSIIAVDLATGDRTVLMDHSTGTGPLWGIERMERTRDGLLLTDRGLQAVLALEFQFGQRTILARRATTSQFLRVPQ
jgi:DNA-binding beta-propeller fold protein YncE